jgi:hypothetical protein
MTIVAIMAGFSFGYCVVDMIQNYRANKRLEGFMKEFEQHD